MVIDLLIYSWFIDSFDWLLNNFITTLTDIHDLHTLPIDREKFILDWKSVLNAGTFLLPNLTENHKISWHMALAH